MANLDTSMSQMLESLESMKPAYAYALQMLEKSSGASSGIEQKVRNRFASILKRLQKSFGCRILVLCYPRFTIYIL